MTLCRLDTEDAEFGLEVVFTERILPLDTLSLALLFAGEVASVVGLIPPRRPPPSVVLIVKRNPCPVNWFQFPSEVVVGQVGVPPRRGMFQIYRGFLTGLPKREFFNSPAGSTV